MNGRHAIWMGLAVTGFLLGSCDRLPTAHKAAKAGPSPYDFTMQVHMTPRAAEAMKAQRSSIRITAFYYGFAKPEFKAGADRLNRIELGSEAYDYPRDAATVRFPAESVDVSRLNQVERGEVWVLTNVGSIDKSRFPSDLLDCKEFTGPVEVARTVPQTAECDLGEGDR